MMAIKRILSLPVLAIIFFGIQACAMNVDKDEDSPFYSVAVGSTLVLNRELTIPANEVAVYLQNGKVLAYRDVDKYRPNCKFEIYTMSEDARGVQADTFEITRVVDEIESSSIQPGSMLASVDYLLAERTRVFGMLDQSEMFNYATFLYLRSDRQKDVYRMICQHWESVLDDKHLSITQMRTAMGEVFTLNIKE